MPSRCSSSGAAARTAHVVDAVTSPPASAEQLDSETPATALAWWEAR
jgi:hypothetical protein